MAGRTGTSIAMGIAITLLSVAALGFFITTIVFFGKSKQMERDNLALKQGIREFVSDGERNDDQIRALVGQAKAARLSLVGYLSSSQQTTMQRVTGQRRDSFADFEKKIAEIAGADNASLVQVIAERGNQIAALQKRLDDAEAARKTAQADQQAEIARVAQIMKSHQDTIDALNVEIAGYKEEISGYRDGLATVQGNLSAQVQRAIDEANAEKNTLQTRIADLQQRNLILEDQLTRLRGEKRGLELRGTPEEALVDGTIISLEPGRRDVYINLGRKQKAVLGMTFAVYNDAASIRTDAETGDYVPGKATLEVISVGEDSSTARIISETRGNPIVRGDVIANAVYDPNKQYKFVVFGNFDTDRDGRATPGERDEIRNMVAGFDGVLIDAMQGDVDFLVLGAEPVLPPRPGVDAPREVVQAYIRLEGDLARYRDLQKTATATGVPILNENRLYTLIGKTPSPVRSAAAR